jgi:septal ring factor EnvC (AmiA/AmiB activator)
MTRQQTHYEGCHEHHLECALAKLERTQASLAASEAELHQKREWIAKLEDALGALHQREWELRNVVYEFAVAGIERDAGKYLVVQVSHETMEEARRLALATDEEKS